MKMISKTGVCVIFILSLICLSVYAGDLSLENYLDEQIYTGQEYTKLFKIKNLDYQSGNSSTYAHAIAVKYNLTKNNTLIKSDSFFIEEIKSYKIANTGSFQTAQAGDFTLCGKIISSSVKDTNPDNDRICTNFTVVDTSQMPCDLKLGISTNQTLIYQMGQSIKFKPTLSDNSFPFVIEYWIEDLFGNEVKKRYNTSNTNQKTWKTKISETDRVLFIKAEVYPTCQDNNSSNNYAEYMFLVVDNSPEALSLTGAEDSSITIKSVSPEEPSFGAIVKAELEIFKGDTAKYSISAVVKRGRKTLSETTKTYLRTKNTAYQINLPIQLKPNCEQKIDDGEATLIIEGLGVKAEKEFDVSGINDDLCQEIEVESNSDNQPVVCEVKETNTDQKETECPAINTLSNPEPDHFNTFGATGLTVYESSSEKAKRMIPLALIIVLVLVCLVLILKK